MQSIARIFGKLNESDRPISPEQLVLSAWCGAVGTKLAGRTRAVKLVRTRLVIEVEDQIWQRQLFVLSRQILANLEAKLGRGLVEDLEFRIAPKRLAPQRATASVFSQDEADQIADPVMRQIYKAARRKGSA